MNKAKESWPFGEAIWPIFLYLEPFKGGLKIILYLVWLHVVTPTFHTTYALFKIQNHSWKTINM